VQDGDEYDKDMYLRIRYAVDNGAKVINGSLLKSFLHWSNGFYDANKICWKKDVLFVHAGMMMQRYCFADNY
jgi:hypothetical protein